jgi:hypothetical protein
VQVWLAADSENTAARVRFTRPEPRRSVDGKIVAVAADGGRFTVAVPPAVKGGEPVRLEIRTTGRSELLFSNVGPGGARPTVGYHVRGWLEEGSEDTADELLVSGSEKTDDRKPVDKR